LGSVSLEGRFDTMKSNVLVDFPSCVNPQVNELIVRYARQMELPAKKVFVQPGDLVDSIYYIHSGRTRHYMVNADGIEKVTYILNKGWFLREGVFIRAQPRMYAERFSITELPTVIYVIDRRCYDKLSQYPEFSKELFRSSTAKNDLLRREMESIIFDSAKVRLLKLLCVAAKTPELVDGYWYRLKISYSHQELAAIVGVNRVTVSRFIATLKQSGDLRTVNRNMQIHADTVGRLLRSEAADRD
jgi:CRP/FNR family cyclic AMP-dependent transcriptional regulator